MASLASDAALEQVAEAEELEASGHSDRAGEVLTALVDAVDSGSETGPIRRCLELATRIGAHDLALHYGLCLWCARPGNAGARRALCAVALFHPDPRVAGAGYRISLERARTIDWLAIADADSYTTWPQIGDLCGPGPPGPRTIAELVGVELMRAIGTDGSGAWVLGPARVTRAGRSIAIGVAESGSRDRYAYVPALSVWDPSAALRWTGPPPREAHDRLALLATRFSFSGYWHWLIEGLLNAVRLDEAGLLRATDRLVICVDGDEPRFITESLQAVGISPANILVSAMPFDHRVSELVLPMRAAGFGGLVDENEHSDLRHIILQNAKHDNGPDILAARRRLGLESRGTRRSSRLLVSRRDAAKRRIVNEDALLSALAPLGFEVIVPGTLSFDEQVSAFSSAEVVVGPHGAGLANALFMPRGGSMLELHHEGIRRPWYRRLAGTLGLGYRNVVCEPDKTSGQDMIVTVDAAETAVRDLLAR
jgi:capsular polysaccharide biosynthesis protein